MADGPDYPRRTETVIVGANDSETAAKAVDAAKQCDASIIVVGNVRMQCAGRLLGSVANDIAHHAPCDVFIVKTV
jgi:nucleotide-binding universal stress UspA family protein